MTFTPSFKTLEQMIAEVAAAVRPPERMTVSQAAEKYRLLNNPGAYVGPFDNTIAPYLVEPMDELTSHDFTGMAFVGPAQAGKTEMVLSWLTYSAICDPADMMIIEKSNTAARDFSIRRLDKLHRTSKELKTRLMPGKNSDNVFDKHYSSGMLLTMSWPTINELSGKPVPRLWLSDYDRMPVDIDGDGSPFDLSRKRATTFRSFGMCVAESSPGFLVEDTKWRPTTPHEGPPAKGIMEIYNKGDRRRFYWRCISCHNAFEPDFELLDYPDSKDLMEAAEAVVLKCPHCARAYTHDPSDTSPGKREMSMNGRWIKDGMMWRSDGQIVGKPIRSDIASFWLKGVVAAFTDWTQLVHKYLTAMQQLESTGSEESLKTTINTDQGKPYTPRALAAARSPQELASRRKELGIRVVPLPVRFLIASVDIQNNRFVVQVHGLAENRDIYVVDRFEIKKSRRVDEDGERLWVKPASHFEDWKLLIEEVLLKTYALADGSGRHMAIHLTVCDTGGTDGVTANAYDFYRWLGNPNFRKASSEQEQGSYKWEPGLSARFYPLKGAPNPSAPRVKIDYPDSQRKDRTAGARGEIPVMFINSNMVKDQLNNMLDREEPGGRIVFPQWLDDNFFTELTVETKDPKKGWVNPRKYRNESWDCLAYCIAACLSPKVNYERIRWDNPPTWAEQWDSNTMVFNPVEVDKPFDAMPKRSYDLAKLAEELG